MKNYFQSTVNTSMAHISGNVTSIVMDYCRSSFPKGFFKSSNVNTRIAIKDFKEVNDRFGFLQLKKNKPIISITPKMIPEETEFNIDFVRRRYLKPATYDATRPDFNDIKLFKDFEKSLFIDYSVERMKMEFELVYVLSTNFMQYNTMGYMLNNMRFDQPFYHSIIMEAELPPSVINQLSKDSGIPVFDEHGSVKPFVDYMNKNSSTAISYRFKGATKQYRFFALIGLNLYMHFNGRPDMDEGDRTGQTTDDFKITHNVTVEFNYPSAFYYLSGLPHDKIEESQGEMLVGNLSSTDIIPLLTMQMPEVYNRLEDGKTLSISTSFNIDDPVKDVTPISSLFDLPTQDLHEIMRSYYIDLGQMYKVILYRESELVPEEEFSVDWKTFELTVINAGTEKSSEYQLMIYEDLQLINELKDKLYNRDLVPTKTHVVLGQEPEEPENGGKETE